MSTECWACRCVGPPCQNPCSLLPLHPSLRKTSRGCLGCEFTFLLLLLQMGKWPRTGWTGLGASWDSGRWNGMSFKVHSVILRDFLSAASSPTPPHSVPALFSTSTGMGTGLAPKSQQIQRNSSPKATKEQEVPPYLLPAA